MEEEAFRDDPDLHTWDEISAQADLDVKKQIGHATCELPALPFMDGMLPVSGSFYQGKTYPTAARDDKGIFVYVKASSDGSGILQPKAGTEKKTTSQGHHIESRGL